jgi:hypothetical protein
MSNTAAFIRSEQERLAARERSANDYRTASEILQMRKCLIRTFMIPDATVSGIETVYLSSHSQSVTAEVTIAGRLFVAYCSGATAASIEHLRPQLVPTANTRGGTFSVIETPSALAEFFDDVESGEYARKLVRHTEVRAMQAAFLLAVSCVMLILLVTFAGYMLLGLPVAVGIGVLASLLFQDSRLTAAAEGLLDRA